jgi:hypothetical protein
VELHPPANNGPVCSGCGRSGPCYDRLAARRFELVPLWGMKVFLVYAPRRVECMRCGVRVEEMPWADGKHPVTQVLCLVSGELGEAAVPEGSSGALPQHLARGLPCGRDGGG